MEKILKISIILAGIFFLIEFTAAAQQYPSVPENLEEAQRVTEGAFEVGKERLPDIIKKSWNEEVIPIWKAMYDWYYQSIGSKLDKFFAEEVKPRIALEIEKSKPVIKEEFKKEKKEMKEDIPGVCAEIKDMWRRLKELWEEE